MSRKNLTPIGLVQLSADPGSATNGDVYYNTTSSVVRAYLNGTWTSLAASGGTISTSNAVVAGKLSGDQTITSGSDTLISFVDDYDPNNWWDASTKRFTPNITGYYAINFSGWWASGSLTTGQTNIQARKNGNTFAIYQFGVQSSSGYTIGGTKVIYLNGSTDYVDFTAYTSNTTSQVLQYGSSNGQGTYFSAALMTSVSGSGGVTQLTAGDGISVSASTGNIIASNTGVLSFGGATGTATVSTSNGVTFSTSGSALTFSLSQDLRTSGTPSFSSVTATTVTATTVNATTVAGASSVYNSTNASGTLTIGNTAVTTGVSAVLNLGTAAPGYTGVNTVNIGTGTAGLGATNVVNIATTEPSNSGYNTVNIATGTPSTSTRQTVTIGNSANTTVNISGSSITLGSFTSNAIIATSVTATTVTATTVTATNHLGTNVGTSGAPITTIYASTVNATTVAATGTSSAVTLSASGAITGGSTLTIAGVIDGCTRINTGGKSATTTAQEEGAYIGAYSVIARSNAVPLYVHRYGTSGTSTFMQFYYNGTANGVVNIASGGTPAFASGSDYRMKTGLEPMTDAIERMKKAQAYTFRKIAAVDPEQNLQTGFIAHELADVQPDAVIGEKDAVDENGDPVYQQVMEAKLIPVMAQAINDLIHKVEALEARVIELENK